MSLQSEQKSTRKLITATCSAIFFFLLLTEATIFVYATPQYGFGTGQGRIDTVNEQDYHTNQWERFNFNYQFTSGSDHRFELGTPTTFSGFVPVDVFTLNIRRDTNVSLFPPSYGIFSATLPTPPTNNLFTQPANPNFYQPAQLQDPNTAPRYDTLRNGVNATPVGNPFNMQNISVGEFLPPTSVLP